MRTPEMDFYLFHHTPEELVALSPAFSLPHVKRVMLPSVRPLLRLCVYLPFLQIKYGIDILHTQNNLPVSLFPRGVVTRHDLLFETHPEFFRPSFKLFSKLLMQWSTTRAKHLFTISDHSRGEILRRYTVVDSKITVIYNGVDRTKFHPGGDGREIIEGYGLQQGGYLLTVGRKEPRKNYSALIRAYERVDIRSPLVIIGQRYLGSDDIDRQVARSTAKDRIVLLEDIKDNELPAFYRHAKLFIYPSIAEGFGIPIVEAMASGVPVICSRTTAMGEVGGSAAVFIDPYDDNTITAAGAKVLSDETLQDQLKRSGLKNVERFSWDESARRVVNVYKALLDDKRT